MARGQEEYCSWATCFLPLLLRWHGNAGREIEYIVLWRQIYCSLRFDFCIAISLCLFSGGSSCGSMRLSFCFHAWSMSCILYIIWDWDQALALQCGITLLLCEDRSDVLEIAKSKVDNAKSDLKQGEGISVLDDGPKIRQHGRFSARPFSYHAIDSYRRFKPVR
jgi:hypothetical protein